MGAKMRGGETKIAAFSFYPEDEDNLTRIKNMLQLDNRSEAVRVALLHYSVHLQKEAEKRK